MATKTISIELDVYERLRGLRQTSTESFSQVLRRELPKPKYWTGADFVAAIDSGEWKGIGLTEEGIELIEELNRNDAPPRDKWAITVPGSEDQTA